jgi:hypothetical protein
MSVALYYRGTGNIRNPPSSGKNILEGYLWGSKKYDVPFIKGVENL